MRLMNRRRSLFVCLPILLGLMQLPLAAQSTTFISNDIKVKTTLTPADVELVKRFVNDTVAQLKSADSAAQASAREKLGNESAANPQPSPAYLNAYAGATNVALTNISREKDVRIRLNAAIAVARIAERANNDRLTDVTLELMRDPSEAVALWGVKSAKWIIPPNLNFGFGARKRVLIDELPKVVDRHNSAHIVAEAYLALTQDVTNNPRAAVPANIKAVVPIVHQLLAGRVAQYAKGKPADPLIERSATFFLTMKDVWNTQDARQQLETVQLITNLTYLAAQGAVAADKNRLTDDRVELVGIMSEGCKALWVIGLNIGNADLQAAVQAGGATNLLLVDPNASVANLRAFAREVMPAFRANPAVAAD